MLPASLKRYAWLSIAAALATILLKGWAWWLTGSVGLLSDALESMVNLVAAIVALIALTVAARPPDTRNGRPRARPRSPDDPARPRATGGRRPHPPPLPLKK